MADYGSEQDVIPEHRELRIPLPDLPTAAGLLSIVILTTLGGEIAYAVKQNPNLSPDQLWRMIQAASMLVPSGVLAGKLWLKYR